MADQSGHPRTIDGAADNHEALNGAVSFRRLESETGDSVLEVVGDLDIAVSAQLESELTSLLRSGGRRVGVDLSSVAFMDSSALSALIQANERAKREGQELVLLYPSPPCSKVLAITGLDRVFGLG